MALYLQRLGRFSYRRRGLVLALWLGVLLVAGAGAATLSGPTVNGFTMPGTESQRALDLLEERFPEAAADGATARIVFATPDGSPLTTQRWQDAVGSVVSSLQGTAAVATVADPYQGRISEDGSVGFAQVTYSVAAADISDEARGTLDHAIETGRAAGLTVEAGGEAVQEAGAHGASELIGLGVAAVVLFITLGSLVAAGLPLLVALVGVGIAVSSIIAATGFMDLSANTPTLAVMLGLAVAIDYSLFVVSRYRQELARGHGRQDAAGRAVGTAGSAVVFAGLTVAIALVGLAVVNIPFLTEMGVAAAFAVLLAVVVSLTMVPALLGFAGARIHPRRSRADQSGDSRGRHLPSAPTRARRWVTWVTRHPVAVLVATVVALGVAAIPALDMRLALPNDGAAAPDTSARKAYDLLSDNFGTGFNGPLTITVDTRSTTGTPVADPQAVADAIGAEISRLDNVATVRPAQVNAAGDTAILGVVPETGPSATETADLVRTIRDLPSPDGAEVSVTGTTALAIDVTDSLGDALLTYLLVVVGLALILLCLVFRSVLVPLKAIGGFLLTVVASLGVVVAVFQWGWFAGPLGIEGQTGPITSLLPVLIIGLVFGLAMDYQVFLVTGMREQHVHGARPTEAVISGFDHGARVVSAAAIIMISVFAGFILSPEILFKQVGLALALGVAIDAFIVRMTLVPAVMALLGRSAWWMPRWLDRVLPNVDVEGTRLVDHGSPAQAAPDGLAPELSGSPAGYAAVIRQSDGDHADTGPVGSRPGR
ncbi:MMPL family transporter [Parafrankia elaeagni]|uniref:MMPL family transporter n=1 Tax=Parafrankia elaeagni TaxID=222534 RepID=UPI00036D45CD|nr:MMPL family transporter [Parafrankia elaeagni]